MFSLGREWRFLEVGDDVDLGSSMLDVSRREPSDDIERSSSVQAV